MLCECAQTVFYEPVTLGDEAQALAMVIAQAYAQVHGLTARRWAEWSSAMRQDFINKALLTLEIEDEKINFDSAIH